ncbi:MAG: hypothetical protein MdMp014T_2908 [Treponematales bacterium]
MSRNIHWLLVVEGGSDIRPYKELLREKTGDGFAIKYAGGKSRVLNCAEWKSNTKPNTVKIGDLENYYGQADFEGVLLLIDSDADTDISKIITNTTYKRCTDTSIVYEKPSPMFGVKTTPYGEYMHIDTLLGQKLIPIYGLAIPAKREGCVETALLNAYGYPTSASEHEQLRVIADNVGKHWCNDTTDFFALDKNGKAKADKFSYNAFLEGIRIFDELKVKNVASLVVPEIDLIVAIMNGTIFRGEQSVQ